MISKSISFIALAGLLAACSDDSSSSSDSSKMKLSFSSSNSNASLALADTVLTINDAIELSYAKFSIAKIKVKANKDRSDDEKALDEQENTEEKAAVDNLDSVMELDTAALRKGDSDMMAKGKQEKEDRIAKIKEKKDELKKSEEDSLKKESDRDDSTKFRGPYVFDAITGAIEGESPIADLSEGAYRRIQFQMKRNMSVAETEALFGNVFAMKGSFTKDGVAVPFEIDWHVALNFRMVADKDLDVTEGVENPVVIDFQVSKWFDGIDLSTAEKAEDGTIYINRGSNREILHAMHKNIKLSTGFGKDKDGDKKLSDSERVGNGEDTTDAEVE